MRGIYDLYYAFLDKACARTKIITPVNRDNSISYDM